MSAASNSTTSANNIISKDKLVRYYRQFKISLMIINAPAFIVGSNHYLASFLSTNNVRRRRRVDLRSTNGNNCPDLPQPKGLQNERKTIIRWTKLRRKHSPNKLTSQLKQNDILSTGQWPISTCEIYLCGTSCPNSLIMNVIYFSNELAFFILISTVGLNSNFTIFSTSQKIFHKFNNEATLQFYKKRRTAT